MKYNAYKTMLDEIGKTKPISKTLERTLFEEYETASDTRKHKIKKIIISANMRFVLKLALAYRSIRGVDIAELVSEGKLGLLKAFDGFDWKKDIKFISYAVWDVRAKMSTNLKELNLIYVPPKKIDDCRKMRKETRDLKAMNDMNPDMYYIHELTNNQVSLDHVCDGSNAPLSDVIMDEKAENAETKYLSEKLRNNLLNHLSTILDESEFKVLTGFFGFNEEKALSLRDLGDKLNKSHERIRQIRDSGMRKLRKSSQIPEFKQLFTEISSINA